MSQSTPRSTATAARSADTSNADKSSPRAGRTARLASSTSPPSVRKSMTSTTATASSRPASRATGSAATATTPRPASRATSTATTPRPASRAAVTTTTPRPTSRATGATSSSARSATHRTTPSASSRTSDAKSSPTTSSARTSTLGSRPISGSSSGGGGGLMGSRYASEDTPAASSRVKSSTSSTSSPKSAPAPRISAATLKRLSGSARSASPTEKDEPKASSTRTSTSSAAAKPSTPQSASARSSLARDSIGSRSSLATSNLSEDLLKSPDADNDELPSSPAAKSAAPDQEEEEEIASPTTTKDAVQKQEDASPATKDAVPDPEITSPVAKDEIQEHQLTTPANDKTQNPEITPPAAESDATEPDPSKPSASLVASKYAEETDQPAQSTRGGEAESVEPSMPGENASQSKDNAPTSVSPEEKSSGENSPEATNGIAPTTKDSVISEERKVINGTLPEADGLAKSDAKPTGENAIKKSPQINAKEPVESSLRQDNARAETSSGEAPQQTIRSLQEALDKKQSELETAQETHTALRAEVDKLSTTAASSNDSAETIHKLRDQLANKTRHFEEIKAVGVTATAEAEKFIAQNKQLLEAQSVHKRERADAQAMVRKLGGELDRAQQEASRVHGLEDELETAKRVLKEIEESRDQNAERTREAHGRQVMSLEAELKSVQEALSNARREHELGVDARTTSESKFSSESKRFEGRIKELESELRSADEALDVQRKLARQAADERSEAERSRERAAAMQQAEIEAMEKRLENMQNSVKASEQRAESEAGFRTLHERESESQVQNLNNEIDKLKAAVRAAEKRADDEASARNDVEERGDKALQEQRRDLAEQCVMLNKELEARKHAFQKLEEFFRADEDKIPELEAKIVDLEQNNAALRDAQQEDDAKIKELEGSLQTQQNESTVHIAEITELKALLEKASQNPALAEVTREAPTEITQTDSVDGSDNSQPSNKIQELEAALAEAKSSSNVFEAKSKQLAAQIDRLIGDRKNIQFERDQFEEDKDRIERKLTDITSALSLSYGQGMTRLREHGLDSETLFDQSHMHSRNSSETGFSLLEEINRSRAILDAFSRFNPDGEQSGTDGQLKALLDMGMPVPPSSTDEPFVPQHWKHDVSKHVETHLTSLRDELDKLMKYMNLDKNHFLHEWHIAETFGHLQVERLQRVSDNYMSLVDTMVEKLANNELGAPQWNHHDAPRSRQRSHRDSHSTAREASVSSVVFSNPGSPITPAAQTNGVHPSPAIERLIDAQKMTDASLLMLANKVRSIRSFHDSQST